MQAKLYNRALRAHKPTIKALWRCLLPFVLAWQENTNLDQTLKVAADTVRETLESHASLDVTIENKEQLESVILCEQGLGNLDEFEKSQSATTK